MNFIKSCSRISICSATLSSVRPITTSSTLYHNPSLKKKQKKVLDQKKLQKQKLKQEMRNKKAVLQTPIDPDALPDLSLFEEERRRPETTLSEDVLESRALLHKEWCRYQMKNHVEDLRMIRDKIKFRSVALRELQKESQFLYDEALKVDKIIFPMTIVGPMETPPLEAYDPPDFVD